jgi:hypothetical protein
MDTYERMGSGSNVDRRDSKFLQPGATPGLLAAMKIATKAPRHQGTPRGALVCRLLVAKLL